MRIRSQVIRFGHFGSRRCHPGLFGLFGSLGRRSNRQAADFGRLLEIPERAALDHLGTLGVRPAPLNEFSSDTAGQW